MTKLIAALLLLLPLGGCASFAALPIATQISIVGAGVAGATLGLSAFHDCRQDGGCKTLALPK